MGSNNTLATVECGGERGKKSIKSELIYILLMEKVNEINGVREEQHLAEKCLECR